MNEGMLYKMNSLNIVIGRKMLVDRFGASQMIIMNYILHHRDGVYQKDLENILNLTFELEEVVKKGLSKEEIDEFNHIIDSMHNNLIAYLGKDSYDKIN